MKFTKLSLIILLTATTAVQAGLSPLFFWFSSIGVPFLNNADKSREGVFTKRIFDTKHGCINWDQISEKKLLGWDKYDQEKLAIGTLVPLSVTASTRLMFPKTFAKCSKTLGIANCIVSLLLSHAKFDDEALKLCRKAVNHKATKQLRKSVKKFLS